MPLYEYQCKKCKHVFEKIHQSYSDPRVKKCPKCSGPVEELLSAPAVQFKGTGWYVTDYARKGDGGSSKGAGSGGDDSSASTATEKTESKTEAKAEAKETKGSKESKPKAESKKKK